MKGPVTEAACGCPDQHLALHRRTAAGVGVERLLRAVCSHEAAGKSMPSSDRPSSAGAHGKSLENGVVTKPPSLTVRVPAPRKLSTVGCDTIINSTVN